ncbi:MAG TPA: phenylacetate--CoA ligase family protein [Candidatus Altiarchaeales archaeon]|nr:phenylacetate--CoA ligase family protein [Candidatus Altiarchaeales archaeon]
MYWNKSIETLSQDKLIKLQEERLRKIVRYCYDNCRFYRERFKDAGIKPDDIKTIDDLTKIPFTTKQDLRDNYPTGLFCRPLEEIVRIHASSGTTGKPTIVGYTKNDIEMWTEVMARSLVTAGCTKKDVLHVAYGYGLFTGGLGFHYGGERVGCMVIPASGGNTKRQLMFMRDLNSTVLCCTPSYAAYIAEVAEEEGISPEKDLGLRLGIFGAEPWSEKMRKRIESLLDLKAQDIYGLSEICGPGVSIECEEQSGLHIWADHFLAEIIDPKTGEQLEENKHGELVITTLTKEGIPLLRYRTRDLTSLSYEECACGRTHPRMSKVTGRTDDMLIIRGVNVFPSQIEHILMKFPEIGNHYLLILDKKGPLDVLTVEAEVTREFLKEAKNMKELEEKIKEEIKDYIGISVNVSLVEPGKIPRSEGKAIRVKDLRKRS